MSLDNFPHLKAGLKDEDWTSLTFWIGTKKPIKAMFFSRKVWIYVDSKTIPLILLVRKNPNGKTKYSFTNMDDISLHELAQRQGQQVFVEKIFEEGKNQVGLGSIIIRRNTPYGSDNQKTGGSLNNLKMG